MRCLGLLILILLSIALPLSARPENQSSADNQDSPQKNLEIFYSLIDSSVAFITGKLPGENRSVVLKMILPGDYQIFETRIVQALRSKGFGIHITGPGVSAAAAAGEAEGKVLPDGSKSIELRYAIDNASVRYGDAFRDGWFGSVKTGRQIQLFTSYVVSENGNVVDSGRFTSDRSDTVLFKELEELENSQFSFTRTVHPGEPFFESLLEPVVAVGAAAAAVYLFFSVRSR